MGLLDETPAASPSVCLAFLDLELKDDDTGVTHI